MSDKRDENDIDRLKAAIRPILRQCENEKIVDPPDIATAVMPRLDEATRYIAAHLEIRQLVREMLRHTYEAGDEQHKRQPTFPGFPLIQRRYPTADRSGYIKSELMSKKDWEFNVRRLRGRGGKLQDHAAQLEAWGKDRFADDRGTAITG